MKNVMIFFDLNQISWGRFLLRSLFFLSMTLDVILLNVTSNQLLVRVGRNSHLLLLSLMLTTIFEEIDLLLKLVDGINCISLFGLLARLSSWFILHDDINLTFLQVHLLVLCLRIWLFTT